MDADGVPLWAGDRSPAWEKYNLPSSPPDRNGRARLWVRVKLPAGSWKDPALLTRGVHQAFEVYFDRRVIYRFGEIRADGTYRFPGYRWFHIIPVSPGSGGRYLYFRFHSNFQSIGLSTLSIDDESKHVTYIIRADIAKFSIGLILVTIGLITVFYTLARKAGAGSRSVLVYFSIFSLCMGSAIIADTRIKEFIISAPYGWLYVRLGCIYFMMIGGAGFLHELVDEKYKKIVGAFRYIFLAYGTTAIGLSLAGAVPVMSTILPFNILLLAGICVMMVIVVISLVGGSANTRVFLAGFLVMVFTAARDALVDMGLLPRYEFIQHWGILFFIACLGLVLIYRIRDMNTRYYGYIQELEIARSIQTSIMPKSLPSVPGIAIAARYLPMETVGGDFYGFHTPDGRKLGVYVSDVVGHGVPAALISSMVKITFELESCNALKPHELLAQVHRKLYSRLESNFFTASYALIDLERMMMLNGNAGHPPLYLWRRCERRLYDHKPYGRIIGPFYDPRYEPANIPILPGDRIILYTDGITEAQNSAGKLFGEDSFREFIAAGDGLAPAEFIDTLIGRIRRWSGEKAGFTDDITIVVIDIL